MRVTGYIVSVRRMVMDNIALVKCPVDPGGTEGSHLPIPGIFHEE